MRYALVSKQTGNIDRNCAPIGQEVYCSTEEILCIFSKFCCSHHNSLVNMCTCVLLQAWADAFRSSPDLTGVVHIYEELKRKGIEFPMADLDALSPIHTPQRVGGTRQLTHAVRHVPVLTFPGSRFPGHAGGGPSHDQVPGAGVAPRSVSQALTEPGPSHAGLPGAWQLYHGHSRTGEREREREGERESERLSGKLLT